MNKTRLNLVTILVVIGMLLTFTVPVQATPPETDLVITADLTMGQDGVSACGTFTISSSLFPADSGTACETFFIDTSDMTIHGSKVLTGANGTIVLKFQAAITAEGVYGHFTIISGTGAYEKLHGVGDSSAWLVYPTLWAVYTGRAHID